MNKILLSAANVTAVNNTKLQCEKISLVDVYMYTVTHVCHILNFLADI